MTFYHNSERILNFSLHAPKIDKTCPIRSRIVRDIFIYIFIYRYIYFMNFIHLFNEVVNTINDKCV